MRSEDLRATLIDAAAGVAAPTETVEVTMQRRVRRVKTTKIAAALSGGAALLAALVFGPQAVQPESVATESAPAQAPPAAPGRLVIPGVTSPIAVVGRGQLAIHDPGTGDRTVTAISRLNGATSDTTAVGVGTWIVVATGGGPGSRAFAVDTHDPAAVPRRLGPAAMVVASTTPGLVWLAQADGVAHEVTLGGLEATGPFTLNGSLVGVTDAGLLVQTATGAAVVDPVTAAVAWSVDGATALAGHGRSVAWCRPGCRRVNVSEINGATVTLPASPGAIGTYETPAAFSPDGRYLAVARGHIVIVHDVTSLSTPAVLAGGGDQARTFAWTGDWLVYSGGSALEIARAPSFSSVRYVEAGIDVRAVVAVGVTPEAGGPTVVAGGPFFGDGWFVRAALHPSDVGVDVCFGVLGPPTDQCVATTGDGIGARLVSTGDRQTVVGVVRDDRITDVRVILGGSSDPVVLNESDIVRVAGGYRTFAWRVPRAGVAHIEGLTRDGQVIAGIAVSVT